mmetsp:Transcript_27220/g.64439  ORF Transcript_27220/g.64439 Transcript_27220/m.64439 type:complete len:311 (+) Transcript_27220:441-1373(+)
MFPLPESASVALLTTGARPEEIARVIASLAGESAALPPSVTRPWAGRFDSKTAIDPSVVDTERSGRGRKSSASHVGMSAVRYVHVGGSVAWSQVASGRRMNTFDHPRIVKASTSSCEDPRAALSLSTISSPLSASGTVKSWCTGSSVYTAAPGTAAPTWSFSTLRGWAVRAFEGKGVPPGVAWRMCSMRDPSADTRRSDQSICTLVVSPDRESTFTSPPASGNSEYGPTAAELPSFATLCTAAGGPSASVDAASDTTGRSSPKDTPDPPEANPAVGCARVAVEGKGRLGGAVKMRPAAPEESGRTAATLS